MNLNHRAAALCEQIIADADRLRAEVTAVGGATLIDLGITARGGLEAGIALSEVCMAGLGRVQFVPLSDAWSGPAIVVATDHPIAACMASQYAGWQIAQGKFFAMGSVPMRAAAGKEELFAKIGHRETAERVVGVLETRKLPPAEVIAYLAKSCRVAPEKLTLLAAPTASQAGGVQIVARSIETALHKMHEIGIEIGSVESGFGVAPLPPVAVDDLSAIGRTNDAILYGGAVTLWLRGDDAALAEIGPRIPSCASADHGRPFREIFERYERDFYRVDTHLFSPAQVTLVNLDSGRTHRFGQLLPDVIEQSFTT